MYSHMREEGLTQLSRFPTHRESTVERSGEGPAVGVTRMRDHTRLLSVAVVQCLGRNRRVVSVGCRSGENGEEKV